VAGDVAGSSVIGQTDRGDTSPGAYALDTPDVGSYHQRDRVHGDLAPALDATGDSPSDTPLTWAGAQGDPDEAMLPAGLDSHRYRCCGNGVVAPVAEWIGRRLRMHFEGAL
jgi:site-specific DNA-cytosine methylase